MVPPAKGASLKSKLLQILAMLCGFIRRQHRRPVEENHLPRNSPEEESRLKFQRFL
jgi:hypothetical protein